MFAKLYRRPLTAVAFTMLVGIAAPAAAAGLIPRATLFASAERSAPVLSPDGKQVAFVGPDAAGLPQVWVRTLADRKERAVTSDIAIGLSVVDWADDRTILISADFEGAGTSHVWAIDVPTTTLRDLTPFRRVPGAVVATSRKKPKQILVAMALRDRWVTDLFSCDLNTGALAVDTLNPGNARLLLPDQNLVVRVTVTSGPTGNVIVGVRDDERSMWRPLLVGEAEDEVRPLEFTRDGKALAIVSSVGTDTAILFERSTVDGKDKVLAGNAEADIDDVIQHPITGNVEAVALSVDKRRWITIEPSVKADYEGLAKLAGDGTFTLVSRDLADKQWVVAVSSDRSPTRYYLWDRAGKKGTLLYAATRKLDGLTLAGTRPISFKARDGLELHGYLTTPAGAGKSLPMVVLVHPGPWQRDDYGFDPTVQWLANRGYAVLQVNYRGSNGFGRKFREAGYREWGRKMQDDLADGVAWAVQQGVADAKRVAIYGDGYGGFAALAGVGLTPDLYAAAVSEGGPVNLVTMVNAVPADRPGLKAMLTTRIGDGAKDRERLDQVSPVNLTPRIKAPVFIAQSAKDERSSPVETERFVNLLDKRGAKLTYVVYEKAAGAISSEADRLDFYARVEAFLAKVLGGQAEPLQGERIKGSSAKVKIAR